MICVHNGQLLATLDGKRAQFLNYEEHDMPVQDQYLYFESPSDSSGPIVSMHLLERYVLLVYQSSIMVFDKEGSLL